MPDEISIEIDHNKRTAKATYLADTVTGIESSCDSCDCPWLNPISVTITVDLPYPGPAGGVQGNAADDAQPQIGRKHSRGCRDCEG